VWRWVWIGFFRDGCFARPAIAARLKTNPASACAGEKRCEIEMPDDDDDLFGQDENETADDFDRLTDVLFQRVAEFAEDEDVSDEALSEMLLRLSLTIRMMTYVMSVAKPSGGGLKLDLDRYRRDAEEFIREMKKDADQIVAQAKMTIEVAALEEDET
jgi:hypothetical protein